MKTFRFTFPEFPLSAVEKRQHAARKKLSESSDPSESSGLDDDFFDDDGAINVRGREYVKYFQERDLKQYRNYIPYYLKYKIRDATIGALVYLLFIGGIRSLLGMDIFYLFDSYPVFIIYFITFTLVSVMLIKKKYKIEVEQWQALQQITLKESEQAQPSKSE